MRIFCLLIFSLLICVPICFPINFIEIDLTKKQIVFDDFRLGDYNIKGSFCFALARENSSLIFSLEGKNISINPITPKAATWIEKRDLSWLKVKLIKRDSTVFINYIRSPEFLMKGEMDLDKNEVVLDVDCNWQEKSLFLEGSIKGKARLWGKVPDLLINGSFNIENGRYQEIDFDSFSLHFLGKPPLLNLTDSQILLADGSSYRIEGVMDIRDFSNLFPKAEFISKNVTLAGWQLLSEEQKSVGLRRNIDDNFDFVFDTYDREDQSMETGAEVRYKIMKDQFLRLRMEEDKTIVGFEKRKTF